MTDYPIVAEGAYNKRGITLASNIEKLFERIINNWIIEEIPFTEGQAGGRKAYSTVDQLYILKSIIEQANRKRKSLYVTFIDIQKAYDKTWQDIVMYTLWQNQIRGKIWRIVRKLNENLTAQCRTNHGLSRKIEIKGSLRQGGVLSVTEFAKMMDNLSQELITKGYGVKCGNCTIPALLLVDDVAILADNEQDMNSMLSILEEFRKKHRLSLSEKKSQIMIVNKKNQKEWKIGNMNIKETDSYTYLGEIITNTNNIEKQIQDKRRKAEAMINNIVNIAKDEVFRQMRINVMLEMYEKCLIPGVLYGAETWHYNKRQLKIIEDIQVNALLRILKLPKSTPRVAVLAETGSMFMEYRIHIKQLNYLYKIITSDGTRWIKKIAENQVMDEKLKENPMKRYGKLLEEYNLTESVMNISRYTKEQWKKEVDETVMKTMNERYNKEVGELSKLKELHKNKKEIRQERYMNLLTWEDARMIFKIRTRMTKIRKNYRNNYKCILCPRCNMEEESEKHLIETCTKIDRTDIQNINYEDVFKEETSAENLKKIARFIRKLEDENI